MKNIFILFLFLFSFSSLYSFNVCNVNFDTSNAFIVNDPSNNPILVADSNGDVFIQGNIRSTPLVNPYFTLGGSRFSTTHNNAIYNDGSQDRSFLSAGDGLVIQNNFGAGVSKFFNSGQVQTLGKLSAQGSQAGCSADGWGYCNADGITRENRDYFCDITGLRSGFCNYNVVNTENCATKTTFDSDGNSWGIGFIRDYTICGFGGNCEYNRYDDYCVGNQVIDYRSSGASYTSASFDCTTLDYTYCSGSTDHRSKSFGCDNSLGCYETSDISIATCTAPTNTYSSWSCPSFSTAQRTVTTFSPTCSDDLGCDFVSSSFQDFDSCSSSEVCRNTIGCAPANNCNFNGNTVLHGSSVDAYSSSTVPFGNSCSSVYQSRTCFDGTLSGSYPHSGCSVLPPSNCVSPWGSTVLHGNDILAFSTSSVPFGSSCQSQTRTCYDGSLSGSYPSQSCSVESCSPSCPAANTICSGTTYTEDNGCGTACNVVGTKIDGVCAPFTYSWQTSLISGCAPSPGCSDDAYQSVWCERSDGVTVSDSFCSGWKPPTSWSCWVGSIGSWNLLACSNTNTWFLGGGCRCGGTPEIKRQYSSSSVPSYGCTTTYTHLVADVHCGYLG